MTEGQFYRLVQEMRQKQREYFKLPPYSSEKQKVLNQSKALERQVDTAIADREKLMKAAAQAQQQSLDFDEPEPVNWQDVRKIQENLNDYTI